jgi:TRAP-type C4-dicarboxylate transport system substrate-binding protein
MLKKRLQILSIVLVFVACTAVAGYAAPEKTWTLKWGTYFSAKDWRQQAADHWASLVKKRTDGRVNIKMFPSNALASTKEAWMLVQSGAISGYTTTSSMVSGAVPAVGLGDIYFSLKGLDAFNKFWSLDGKAQAFSEELCAKQDVKPVGCTIVGFGMFGCRQKHLKSLDDFKGKKIRASGGYQVKSLELWGASAVAMSTAEVYTALQRGVIDGLQTSTYGMYHLKYGEVCKYMTYTPQNVLTPNMWIMSLKTWDSFPQDIKKIINDSFSETQAYAMSLFKEKESVLLEKIEKEQGARIYTLTDLEAGKWSAALTGAYDRYLEGSGEIGHKFIEALKEANK